MNTSIGWIYCKMHILNIFPLNFRRYISNLNNRH